MAEQQITTDTDEVTSTLYEAVRKNIAAGEAGVAAGTAFEAHVGAAKAHFVGREIVLATGWEALANMNDGNGEVWWASHEHRIPLSGQSARILYVARASLDSPYGVRACVAEGQKDAGMLVRRNVHDLGQLALREADPSNA